MSPGPAYCPYYCEENIWQLCADPRVGDGERVVLIISNPARRVAIWGQRLSRDPTLPIAWDYHVVLLARAPGCAWQVWDLDAVRPPPQPAHAWLADSFQGSGLLPPQFTPRFRTVAAADYRRHLRSDRRHMRLADGTHIQPPPSWPPILGEPVPGDADADADDGSNLAHFLDTEDRAFLGQIWDLQGLRAWIDQSAATVDA